MTYETFIKVAPDCPVTSSAVPVARERKSVPVLQDESGRHAYTQDLPFVHVRHKGLEAEAQIRGDELQEACVAKPHACLRASALRYGWGVHFDEAGKIALYGVETKAYKTFCPESGWQILTALRSRRA